MTTPTTKTTRKTRVKLPPNPFAHEVLELASKQKTKAKKIEILQEYESDALKSILIWNFDQTVISLIPEGAVPYTKNEVPVGTDHTSLRREWKNLYHFVKGGNDKISGIRRETMFIQMLEGLHPEEAEIICLVKDKILEDKYSITYDIVQKAYPDIVWGGRS
tara:strand:- start:516 stop:1001 length:486 start_codon:yes stop_codon:yes gene_type:complete